jgi:hypothetical protein
MSQPSPTTKPVRGWNPGTAVLFRLFVAWLVVDSLVVANRDENEYFLIVLLPLLAAQLATLTGWLALGDGGLAPRIGIATTSLGLIELVTQRSGHANPGFPFVVATAYFVVLFVPMFVLSLFGFCCRRSDDAASGKPHPLQFGIRHVIALTTTVAVILALLRILPVTWFMVAVAARTAVEGLIVGILPWTQWAVMLRSNLDDWLFHVGMFVLLAASVVAGLIGGVTGILVVAIHTAALGVNLYFFRAAGYRLVRAV